MVFNTKFSGLNCPSGLRPSSNYYEIMFRILNSASVPFLPHKKDNVVYQTWPAQSATRSSYERRAEVHTPHVAKGRGSSRWCYNVLNYCFGLSCNIQMTDNDQKNNLSHCSAPPSEVCKLRQNLEIRTRAHFYQYRLKKLR
jgi:hypothetical protein